MKPPDTLQTQKCVAGYAAGNYFNELCQFTCKYGCVSYSMSCGLEQPILINLVPPVVCLGMGIPDSLPTVTGVQGYPANGDTNYAGLCSFACNYG